jgi:hypothetical protein
MDNVHRRKCMHDIEAAKLQKEIDEELTLSRSFKGKHPCSYLDTNNLSYQP